MAIDLTALADKWPSALVAREEVDVFTGGVMSPKTQANLDCRGEGPEGAIRIGRKVAYPVTTYVSWLSQRASLAKAS